MKAMSAELALALARDTTTLALCWRVSRADGVTMGFTSHDRDIVHDGMRYLATPGISPAATGEGAGAGVDGSEVAGIIASGAVTARDLDDGRYAGASAALCLIDWTQPAAGRLDLMQGELGSIRHDARRFEAGFQSAVARLEQSPVELVSPECRAGFGDARCKVDASRYEWRSHVAMLVDDWTLELADDVPLTLLDGRLRLLDGAAAGLDYAIMAQTGRVISVERRLSDMLRVGMCVAVRAGCDKRHATCRDVFANSRNFRGEPHVPGMDAILRYPGL